MTVVSTNRNARIDFTALDNSWTVNTDVSVFVQADVAALSTVAGSSFTNNGVVFAAVNFNNGNGAVSLGGNNTRIENNAGASITGYEGGISVNGDGVEIHNRGSVTGAEEFGVLFGGGSRNVVLDNSGNVYGAAQGILVLNSFDGGTINNSGVVRSGDIGIRLSLSTGVTTAIANAENGIIRGNAKAIEVNFGAIDFENLGTVVGLTHCAFQSGNDRIENGGTMGEIRLGSGDDVFVFAGGKQGLVTGGSDEDQFVFESKLASKKNPATIADFTSGEDSFGLSKPLFKGIGKPGPLKEKAFALGTKAGDKSDRIVYDDDSGELRHDKDGKGGVKGKVFAILDGAPDIDAGDFTVSPEGRFRRNSRVSRLGGASRTPYLARGATIAMLAASRMTASMTEAEEVSELIGRIYDAALDPSLWPSVLGETCRFLDCVSGTLNSYDITRSSLAINASYGYDPHYVQLLLDHYIHINPLKSLSLQTEVGDISSVSQLADYATLLETPFWREWAQPQGYIDAMEAKLDKTPTASAALTVIRHESIGQIDADALRRFRLLYPHFRRAVLIGKIIDLKRVEAAAFADVIDGMIAGIFLVDAQGRIVYANPSGQAMLGDGELFAPDRARLAPRDPAADRGIREVLVAVDGDGEAKLGGGGIAIPLSGSNGGRHIAHVLPLTSGARRGRAPLRRRGRNLRPPGPTGAHIRLRDDRERVPAHAERAARP